jgi:hypothetical protein
MRKNFLIACFALIITVVSFIGNHLSQQSPSAKPVSAAANEFSATRAHNLLKVLLAENKPHPVGSQQNKIVKNRITAELDRLNIAWQEQATWACAHKYNGCAFVENIIATIPGNSSDSYIALMAHYDSVPMSPGAGDDGAGVAAILESARALALEAPFQHSIMLLFTDAEEMGLIGAEGFYKQHPLAKQIKLLLNFEGTGTTGQSMILRTTDANKLMLDALVSETSNPFGFSFANEIFKRMPNDTDFSVVQRSGIAGIDFAFAGERSHYHTPNDSVDNIDLNTIQHHGENMLPLVRLLANDDLDDLGEHVVYGGMYGQWIQWASSYSDYLIIACALLFLIALFRVKPPTKQLLIGIPTSIGILIGTIAVGVAAFQLINLMLGTTVNWPADDRPYRATLIFSTAAGGLTMTTLANRFSSQIAMMFAGWLVWLGICTLVVIYLPDAANTFLIPTLFACLLLFVISFLPIIWRPWVFCLVLVGAIPTTLGTVYALEQTQGYTLIAATMPSIGLFMLAFAPFVSGINLRHGLLLTYLATSLSIAACTLTPLYSEWRPQQVNINYFEDLDTQIAYNQLASKNPITEPLASAKILHPETRELLPFSDSRETNWSYSELSGWMGPELTIDSDQISNGIRTVAMTVQSNRGADSIGLVIPQTAKLTELKLGTQIYEPQILDSGVFDQSYYLKFIGVYYRPVSFTLTFNSSEPVVDAFLIDMSTELPDDSQQLIKARTALMSPVHRGDQALLIKRVNI